MPSMDSTMPTFWVRLSRWTGHLLNHLLPDATEGKQLYIVVVCLQCTCLCLECRCRGFESHLRQLIFLRKSDCLRCAVLLCLVCFFLPSFSHLSLIHVHAYSLPCTTNPSKKLNLLPQALVANNLTIFFLSVFMLSEGGSRDNLLSSLPFLLLSHQILYKLTLSSTHCILL